jgi:hypothetical protein
MAFDYAAMRDKADVLLEKFGKAGIIRRETLGGGPPHNPGDPTVTDHACTLVVTKFRSDEIDGTRILATDHKVLVAAGGLEVEPHPTTDKVVAGGLVLAIVAPVMPVKPADTVVLWILQARTV